MKCRESQTRTAYGVHCDGDFGGFCCNDGKILYLTEYEYGRQMRNPDALWKCPRCGGGATWNDGNYDEFLHEECPSENT